MALPLLPITLHPMASNGMATLPPEFLPAEIGHCLYPGSSLNPRTTDPQWICSTRPRSPRGASASHRLDTKPVNYCDQCSRQNFKIGGCRGVESKVVLSDSIDYAIIVTVKVHRSCHNSGLVTVEPNP